MSLNTKVISLTIKALEADETTLESYVSEVVDKQTQRNLNKFRS